MKIFTVPIKFLCFPRKIRRKIISIPPLRAPGEILRQQIIFMSTDIWQQHPVIFGSCFIIGMVEVSSPSPPPAKDFHLLIPLAEMTNIEIIDGPPPPQNKPHPNCPSSQQISFPNCQSPVGLSSLSCQPVNKVDGKIMTDSAIDMLVWRTLSVNAKRIYARPELDMCERYNGAQCKFCMIRSPLSSGREVIVKVAARCYV